MNKLTDKDLREALRRKEAQRRKTEVPADFCDNVMREIAPKPSRRPRYAYIAAFSTAACILFLLVFQYWNNEMPVPSEPIHKIVAEKNVVTSVKEKKAEIATQVQPVEVAVCPARKTIRQSVVQPNTVTATDSLDYYINKIERELAQVDDSLYIERIHRVMHADERLQRIVNSYILNELHQDAQPHHQATLINNETTDDDEE